jgi:hypothetical protein
MIYENNNEMKVYILHRESCVRYDGLMGSARTKSTSNNNSARRSNSGLFSEIIQELVVWE